MPIPSFNLKTTKADKNIKNYIFSFYSRFKQKFILNYSNVQNLKNQIILKQSEFLRNKPSIHPSKPKEHKKT